VFFQIALRFSFLSNPQVRVLWRSISSCTGTCYQYVTVVICTTAPFRDTFQRGKKAEADRRRGPISVKETKVIASEKVVRGLGAGRATAVLQRSGSMKCIGFKKPTRTVVGLLTGVLFVISALPLGAQSATESRPGCGFGPGYDAAHETILTGTIQEVVTKRVVGSPAGIHLLVYGPQGVVDVHVGPFLSEETKESLQAGMPVRIVGAMSSLQGKNYLLARELTVGGSTVIVRSEHGLFVRVHASRAPRARTETTSQLEPDTGAR
jgi:hypothetical protein